MKSCEILQRTSRTFTTAEKGTNFSPNVILSLWCWHAVLPAQAQDNPSVARGETTVIRGFTPFSGRYIVTDE
jgi:hypothetical protein